MKIKLCILLVFIGVIYAITLSPISDETVTVENSLATTNRFTYQAFEDSCAAHLHDTHQANTAYHLKADGVTAHATGKCENLRAAITYANARRAALVEHFAQDSCHVNGADNLTWLPNEISTSASYATYKTYTDSLLTQQKVHEARKHSTRYKILLKEEVADFIAHCAKDTSDASDVHWFPDTLYNSVTADTTNIDSTCASLNRLKSRINPHIADLGFHKTYKNADSITTIATDEESATTLANEIKTKYNTHAVRDTSSTDSVHFKADTNLVTTASVSTTSGHITNDTTQFTGAGHLEYAISPAIQRMTIQYTGSSVSTGASFYHYGSVDGSSYAFIDSTSVTANGATLKHFNTNLYPYMKIYLNKRTDGTYKIQFKGGK